MNTISSSINYLKDPQLVANFQKYFGVLSLSQANEQKVARLELRSGNKLNSLNRTLDHANLKLRHSKTKGDTNVNSLALENHDSPEEYSENGVLPGNTSTTLFSEDTLSSESDVEQPSYVITNKFWYYFFLFGTYLGDEVFYASFIPFWFWNIDGAVGRRIVMVWTIIMYLGQGIKDIVCWPRPVSPPVFRLQKKWSLEHGMPSTHAMVGIAIPFSVIIYTMNRYQYPVALGVAMAVCWCAVISLSRIYLGMHSVLDVVVGLVLAIALMVPVVPIVDTVDFILITNRWSPVALILASIPMIAFYPTTTHWTPTRGDTTTILGFCAGLYIGAWTNYHRGVMKEPPLPPPYTVIWPSWPMFGTGVLRTVIGLCSIVATIAVCKSAQHAVMRCILQDSSSPSSNTKNSAARSIVELTCKFVSYSLIGFNILYLMPNVFKMLSIERPTFYTEI
ncbi:sphingosine-1-phosphate phosphatase 1-like [Macrosteles quadrilineatus]|uniref:sphingosine-1-phosphate phosphatase 1-like n=1 Tax=Macrosteles quadrilineatus TaxID=74068 RepID=UPI0023E20EB9|nr:sphingosine-1-phosphate phosphatase 1-like [Macrosteles quadrilineatus]